MEFVKFKLKINLKKRGFMNKNSFQKPIEKICDLLKSPITCKRDSSVRDVLDLFQKHKIGSVIISDEKKVLGIFTERDYVLKIAGNTDINIDDRKIEEFMTSNPKTIRKDNDLLMGLKYMRIGRFRHLIVVNKDDDLEKVLSIKDFLDFIVDEVNARML